MYLSDNPLFVAAEVAYRTERVTRRGPRRDPDQPRPRRRWFPVLSRHERRPSGTPACAQ